MTADESLLVYSYGGGVQSTAMLVLVAQGYLPPGPFLFANVGDDSEDPDTLRYVREVAFEYAGRHGIDIHEIQRTPLRGRHKGQAVTLLEAISHPDSRSIPIPVRMADTGAPGTRSCTADWKIHVVNRWVRKHGATADSPARVAIGISTDEYQRATSRRPVKHEIPEYPLLTLEHRLAPRGASRQDCAAIIVDAGLPVPGKSSCYFCPFHKPSVFAEQARRRPNLFAKSCDIEDMLNDRRDMLGKDHVFLTRFGRPLRDVFSNVQMAMFDDDEDEGYRCGDVCDT